VFEQDDHQDAADGAQDNRDPQSELGALDAGEAGIDADPHQALGVPDGQGGQRGKAQRFADLLRLCWPLWGPASGCHG
jgi:hypothetical protein